MRKISYADAQTFFYRLRPRDQIATLSPEYVTVDCLRDPALVPLFLVYSRDDKFWLLSAHMSLVPNSEYRVISSPYGYGGPLTNTSDMDFIKDAWEAYKSWCYEHLILADLMKLHPLAAHPYEGKIKFNRMVYTCGKEYAQKCRNTVNKATRLGLVTGEFPPHAIVKEFSNDYREHMKHIGAAPFYMFNDNYFDALSKMDAAHLVVCGKGTEWHSAAIILAGNETMEYHLSVTNKHGRLSGAANHMIHIIRQTLESEAILFLGGGKSEDENDSLAKFKSSFGGEALPFYIGWHIHRPEVYAEMKQGNNSDRIFFWQ